MPLWRLLNERSNLRCFVEVGCHVFQVLDRLEVKELLEAFNDFTHWCTVCVSDPVGKLEGGSIQPIGDLVDLDRAGGQYIKPVVKNVGQGVLLDIDLQKLPSL